MPNDTTSVAEPYLPFPIDFAPLELREHGLREAHSAPFVAIRRADDSVCCLGRRAPAEAWADDAYPLIEWARSGRAYASMILDCDSDQAVSVVFDSLGCLGPLPQPNVVVVRRKSGHAQAAWTLDTPVGRGRHMRRKPIRWLARISEYFHWRTGADSGFRGVLSSQPLRSDYRAHWGRRDPYELRELPNTPVSYTHLTLPTTPYV